MSNDTCFYNNTFICSISNFPRHQRKKTTTTIESIYVYVCVQCRWARSRSKERGYSGRSNHNSESTDYAADNSSDQSPTHSPRHKPTAYGDSPLARSHLLLTDKRDSLSSQIELENNESVKACLTAAQVRDTLMIDSSPSMRLAILLVLLLLYFLYNILFMWRSFSPFQNMCYTNPITL